MHADGPASIQRLRAADLASIDDVLGCSVETTAEVLGLSMAQGRRFHREARMLAMRTQGEGLDREESMYPGGVTAELAAAQAVMQSVAAAAESVEPMSSTQDFRDSQKSKPDIAAILAPVLERWERDDASGREAQEVTMELRNILTTSDPVLSSVQPLARILKHWQDLTTLTRRSVTQRLPSPPDGRVAVQLLVLGLLLEEPAAWPARGEGRWRTV